MKTFRENLSQIAQGQLLTGGYLPPQPAKTIHGKRLRDKVPPQRRVIRWPRLVMPH